MVESYAFFLAGYDMGQIMNAITLCVQQNPIVPTPSHIIANISMTQEQKDHRRAQQLAKLREELEEAKATGNQQRVRLYEESVFPQDRQEWLRMYERIYGRITNTQEARGCLVGN